MYFNLISLFILIVFIFIQFYSSFSTFLVTLCPVRMFFSATSTVRRLHVHFEVSFDFYSHFTFLIPQSQLQKMSPGHVRLQIQVSVICDPDLLMAFIKVRILIIRSRISGVWSGWDRNAAG